MNGNQFGARGGLSKQYRWNIVQRLSSCSCCCRGCDKWKPEEPFIAPSSSISTPHFQLSDAADHFRFRVIMTWPIWMVSNCREHQLIHFSLLCSTSNCFYDIFCLLWYNAHWFQVSLTGIPSDVQCGWAAGFCSGQDFWPVGSISANSQSPAFLLHMSNMSTSSACDILS
jgi:hypothetical protein